MFMTPMNPNNTTLVYKFLEYCYKNPRMAVDVALQINKNPTTFHEVEVKMIAKKPERVISQY